MENKSRNKDKIEIKKEEEKSYLRRWKDFHLYYEDYIDTENYNYEDHDFESLSKIDNIESILSYIGQLISDNFNEYMEGKSNFSEIALDNCVKPFISKLSLDNSFTKPVNALTFSTFIEFIDLT